MEPPGRAGQGAPPGRAGRPRGGPALRGGGGAPSPRAGARRAGFPTVVRRDDGHGEPSAARAPRRAGRAGSQNSCAPAYVGGDGFSARSGSGFDRAALPMRRRRAGLFLCSGGSARRVVGLGGRARRSRRSVRAGAANFVVAYSVAPAHPWVAPELGARFGRGPTSCPRPTGESASWWPSQDSTDMTEARRWWPPRFGTPASR